MNRDKKPDTKWVLGILAFLALIGIGIMVYPMFAAHYAESVRSEIHTKYEEVIDDANTAELDSIWASAMQYNRDLFSGVISPLEPEESGYFEQLKLPDTEVMCYISIPKINVYLPVYHGIGNDALSKGAGHMPQSSLPIGGYNTHAVISAHTGMAQSPMFSDLELMEEGDIFQIMVLGNTITYEVDNINIVLPQEIDSIRIQRDMDLVSLVTCTPYGVNSHRLIVRGHRVENPAEEDILSIMEEVEEEAVPQSVWTNEYRNSVKIGACIAAGIIVVSSVPFIFLWLRKKREGHGE